MALLFHRSTSALHTKVRTKLGVVTLGGKARNAAEKDLVTKLVKDIHGVKKRKEPDDRRRVQIELWIASRQGHRGKQKEGAK